MFSIFIAIVWAVLFLLQLVPLNIFAQSPTSWQRLSAAPSSGGKQDDIWFIDKDNGWSVNGLGRIYKTTDGGNSWTLQLEKKGTFFRCIAFIDEKTGFAGNICPGYFPDVTDTVPLYKTTDGGNTWSEVQYKGPSVKGLCAITIIRTPFINSGMLDTMITLYAAGRVGSPVGLMKSTDAGKTWTSRDMSQYCSMITDIQFIDKDTGFVFGGTNAAIQNSGSIILKTTDGGTTFRPVYTSARPYETIWKACFTNHSIGYATILSYDPAEGRRYVAKTTNGGNSWNELLLGSGARKEFGIAFVNDSTGWLGTDATGYFTKDGGKSWRTAALGTYANKIRIIRHDNGVTAYAIGLNIFKYSETVNSIESAVDANGETIDLWPNPAQSGALISLRYNPALPDIKAELFDMKGNKLQIEIVAKESGIMQCRLPLDIANGAYIIRLLSRNELIRTDTVVIGDVKP
jgi:photosystem II stability/assembly factor-like uncharacterized protein